MDFSYGKEMQYVCVKKLIKLWCFKVYISAHGTKHLAMTSWYIQRSAMKPNISALGLKRFKLLLFNYHVPLFTKFNESPWLSGKFDNPDMIDDQCSTICLQPELINYFYIMYDNKISDEVYTREPWFQFLKQRWSTNFDALEKFYMKIKIRFNESGEYLKKYEHYPNFYR